MLNQIKEALEKATNQGKWIHNGNEFVSELNLRVGIGGFMSDEDNHLVELLVSNAAVLLSTLEEADKEIAKYHKLHDEGYNENRILTEQYEKAKSSVFMWAAECDRLKAELEKAHLDIDVQKNATKFFVNDLVNASDELDMSREANKKLRAEHTAMKDALEEIAEHGGTNMLGKTCAVRSNECLSTLSTKEDTTCTK